jgi:hypothetical protein
MSAMDITTENQTSRDYQSQPRTRTQAAIPDQQQRGGMVDGVQDHSTVADGTQDHSTVADGTRGRSTVAFGARAAILAGMLATGCAAVVPATANAAVAHPAHVMTAVALGAASSGLATPDATSCCG